MMCGILGKWTWISGGTGFEDYLSDGSGLLEFYFDTVREKFTSIGNLYYERSW